MATSARNPDWRIRLVKMIGMHLPSLPRSTAIINRILKPLLLHSKYAPVETEIKTSSGTIRMMLDPHECVDNSLLFYPQLFDVAERCFMAEHLRPGDIFLDVGSNIGFYSLYAAALLRHKGRVIAIEPLLKTFEALKINIQINPALAPIIKTINLAVAEDNKPRKLFVNNNGNLGGSSLVATAQGNSVDVPCDTLLNVLQDENIQNVTMMKIDIEGYEYQALKPFFKTAPSALWPRFIIKEEFDHAGGHNAELNRLLADCGYRLAQKTSSNGLYILNK